MLPAGSAHTTLTTRLNQLVKKMNEMGYLARWEAHLDGPIIELRNCSYAAILDSHPEICLLDRAMLTQHARSSVEQTAKVHLPETASCIFQVAPHRRSINLTE
jgi:predicted ArsR family transcriptional regulator